MDKIRSRRTSRPIRILEAGEGIGMSEAEAMKFLSESRSVIKLGTVDSLGEPNVHPVWYLFEPKGLGLYALIGTDTRKARNIKKSRMVYFLVDQDRWPYRGVRGKGETEVLPRGPRTMAILEKMLARYIKKDHQLHTYFVDSVKAGHYFLVQISPRYLMTWDYGRLPPTSLDAGLDWSG